MKMNLELVHGHVELIHCTPDAEKLITKMARVSAPNNQDNYETAPKLLRYLIKHQHWSPFEMASMCVNIRTERDISAQILRHRSFSFQEFSTRYAQVEKSFITPALRRQDKKNRQNSFDDIDIKLHKRFTDRIINAYHELYDIYYEMLDNDIAKECARRILPLSTCTSLYMHGTLRSWIHYIKLRSGPETQLEHRQVAEDCKEIFKKQFPVIAEAAFAE